MDNYKIRVNNEAESKEAQELFFELGYEWRDSKRDFTNLDVVFIYAKDGVLTAGFNDHNFAEAGHKELTLPQLRDLVVLKRGDVKDANHTYIGGGMAYKTCEDICYLWARTGWEYKGIAHNLVPIKKHLETATGRFNENGEHHLTFSKGSEEKDPALISGAEAKLAWANGERLQIDTGTGFEDLTDNYYLGIFDRQLNKFRLKPQTIKVELELPKPFEPEEDCHVYILDDGKTDGYRRYSYEVHGDKGNTFIGIWRTEEEIKQVVEQLRKIRGAS
ncbi:hypothetical protein QM268_02865 [Acinetobacter baumannii]|nr:hypothetical protein [Acinetobacter baumannii]MDI9691406.1 hypothetical protein [Acinetobacter baumannii]